MSRSRRGGGGIPWRGVPPRLDLDGGVSPTWTWEGGTPLSVDGVSPHPDLGCEYPPLSAGWGTPSPVQTWEGETPPPSAGRGTPLDVNRQTPVKTVPSLLLRTRAVIINMDNYECSPDRDGGPSFMSVIRFSYHRRPSSVSGILHGNKPALWYCDKFQTNPVTFLWQIIWEQQSISFLEMMKGNK